MAAQEPERAESGQADPAALALQVITEFEAGRFEQAHARFSPQLADLVSAENVTELWLGQLDGQEICERGPATLRARADGLVTVTMPVRTLSGGIDVLMSVDGNGIVHGLRFATAGEGGWKAPDYVSPRRFEECEVELGGRDEAVPGTLTLPSGWTRLKARMKGGVPAVVLLAGGGPFDRDETAGPNKPLKDLAWGLATRGVAVLRFDKATLVHAERLNERGFTLADEYLPYATAAIEVLRSRGIVDRDRIF